MGLPRPSIMPGIPETKEQALSDFLLHAGIGAGTVIGVYAYTGLLPGPGHAGIIYRALFSRAVVGSTVGGLQGSVALTETIYAGSVYAEPFVAAVRFIGRWSLPAIAVTSFYIAATDKTPSPTPHQGGVRGMYRHSGM
jgi:hypothetical protein